jgi:hypothetical protein
MIEKISMKEIGLFIVIALVLIAAALASVADCLRDIRIILETMIDLMRN